MSRPDLLLPAMKANPGEVDRIFIHPLEGMLDPKSVNPSDFEGLAQYNFGEVMPLSELVPKGDYWPYDEEFHVGISLIFLLWLELTGTQSDVSRSHLQDLGRAYGLYERSQVQVLCLTCHRDDGSDFGVLLI
jgi:hypothetical protein